MSSPTQADRDIVFTNAHPQLVAPYASLARIWGYRTAPDGDHMAFEERLHSLYPDYGVLTNYTDPLFRGIQQLSDPRFGSIFYGDVYTKLADAVSCSVEPTAKGRALLKEYFAMPGVSLLFSSLVDKFIYHEHLVWLSETAHLIKLISDEDSMLYIRKHLCDFLLNKGVSVERPK